MKQQQFNFRAHMRVHEPHVCSKKYVLPPTRNDRPFCDNFVMWGPMKLVSGSNKSLGTYRFDEISTVALGQVLEIEKLIS